MKSIFTLCFILVLSCLFSCISDNVSVQLVGSSDTIPLIENRLNLNVGDTCIVEKRWLNYFDGTYYREEYKTVTKIESEQRLKTGFTWIYKGTPKEKLVEGVSYCKGLVVAKY